MRDAKGMKLETLDMQFNQAMLHPLASSTGYSQQMHKWDVHSWSVQLIIAPVMIIQLIEPVRIYFPNSRQGIV